MTPASEVAARWCYAELRSSRFGRSYIQQKLVSKDLWDKANAGVAFGALDDLEVQSLRDGLSKHDDRGPAFYPMLMTFPDYVRERWSYSQLSQVIMVPYYGCLPFIDFEKSPHDTMRTALESIPKSTFRQDEPVIVVPFQGKQMLLEGTLRSLLFARDREDSSVLEVWVPAVRPIS